MSRNGDSLPISWWTWALHWKSPVGAYHSNCFWYAQQTTQREESRYRRNDYDQFSLFFFSRLFLAIVLSRFANQPLLCVANVCKAMCGVAGGSVGGAINLYWAAKGTDISEIAAKFGAQQTVTASLGLVFAALFAKSLSTVDARKVWILYLLLTALHIFANMQCMRIMAFDTLNTERMEILFRNFHDQYQTSSGSDEKVDDTSVQMLTPRQVASCESLFFWPKWGKHHNRISFGVSLNELLNDNTEAVDKDSLSRPHWISTTSNNGIRKPKQVKVALNAQSTPRQTIRAYFEALWIGASSTTISDDTLSSVLAIERDDAWNLFSDACEEAGWNLDQHNILTKGYEVSFIEES